MTGGFVVGALEKNYAFLDECPPNLLAAVITLPVGTLPERVAGARCWYDALLDGRLPPPGTWPQAPLDVPARQALDSMGLVRFCKEQPEIVKSLMTDVLSSFSRQSATFREEVATQLQKLEELERIRLAEEALDLDVQKNLVTSRKHQLKDIFLDEATLERLRQEAEAEVARRARDTDAEMTKAWGGAIARVGRDRRRVR
jgi:hypothetical protein